MQLKKKQHYVWREYLRNWSNKELINCFIKSQNKVITPNIVNTSQENYFYKIPEYNNDEILEIIDIAKDHSNAKLFPHILKIIYGLFQISELSNVFKEDNENLHIVEALKTNSIEDLLTQIEDLGKNFIKIDSSKEFLELISDEELYSQLLIFIGFQYVRTNKMKSLLTEAMGKNKLYKKKYWLIIQIIYGFEISFKLSINRNVTIKILENKSVIDLITSDQPVFNLLSKDKDEKGYVKGLELYYPLNKKLAIIICYGKKGNFPVKNLSEDEVVILNKEMFNNSYDYVYFNNEQDIRNFR